MSCATRKMIGTPNAGDGACKQLPGSGFQATRLTAQTLPEALRTGQGG